MSYLRWQQDTCAYQALKGYSGSGFCYLCVVYSATSSKAKKIHIEMHRAVEFHQLPISRRAPSTRGIGGATSSNHLFTLFAHCATVNRITAENITLRSKRKGDKGMKFP